MGCIQSRKELEEVDNLTPEDISYKDYNSGNCTHTLILIHCFSGDQKNFDNIVPELQKLFRVITYDMAGFGKTKRVKGCSYTLKESANHLKVLMSHLKISKAHILGHSLGGKVGLEFLKEYPEMVISLILEDINITASKQMYLNFELVPLRKLADKGVFEWNTLQEAEAAFKEAGIGPHYNHKIVKVDDKFKINFSPQVFCQYLESAKVDQTENLKQAKCDILILISDQNEIPPSDFKTELLAYWHKEFDDVNNLKLTNVTVKRIPDSMHFMHKSHPKEVIEAVTSFIK